MNLIATSALNSYAVLAQGNPPAEEGSLVPFSGWELGFIAVYLLSLIAIGAVSFVQRKENSLKDF